MQDQPSNPFLRWTDGQRDLGGNVLRPPKDVWLMERWWGDEVPVPSPYFTVHQVFDSIFRRVLSYLGAETERDITQIETVVGADPRTATSASPWSLAAAHGGRARAVYVFRNTSTGQSPRLIAHRFGDITFEGAGEISAEGEVGVASVGTNGRGEIGTKVITAIDPNVRVQLLFPWERGERSLLAYARDRFQATGDVDVEQAIIAFGELLGNQLPAETPNGWSFVHPPGRMIPESQPAAFSIGVDAQAPGRTLFALQVEEVGNPENAACSELLELEVTEDLEILVHFDTEPAGAAPAGAA